MTQCAITNATVFLSFAMRQQAQSNRLASGQFELTRYLISNTIFPGPEPTDTNDPVSSRIPNS